MSNWLLAAAPILFAPFVTAAATHDAPTAAFYALLTSNTAGRAYQIVSGGATFTVEGDKLHYTLEVAEPRWVTRVVLEDGTRSIELYDRAAAKKEPSSAHGVIAARSLGQITVAGLIRDIESGKVDPVVVHSPEGAGTMRGRVLALPAIPDPESLHA
jgi:hypothetical protein